MSDTGLERLHNRTLDTVERMAASDSVVRFHVWDPTIDTAEPALDLTFHGVQRFDQLGELSDVILRETALPDEYAGQSLTAFEFIHVEAQPTEGRPYQAEILEDGSSRILFGTTVEHRRALLIAERIVIAEAPAQD